MGAMEQYRMPVSPKTSNFALNKTSIKLKLKMNMKQNKFFLGLATIAAALTFASCSSEEPEIQTQSKEDGGIISLTSSISKTRTTSDPQATALNTSNAVGVFVTDGAAAITNGTNNQHSVGSDGSLTTSNAMTYPSEDGATVNIYAYAPYAAGMTLGDNSFSVATNQDTDAGYLASDLVWASKEGQTSSSSAVSLAFTHKLSLLNITISNASDSGISLDDAVVSIIGTKIATTFNTQTGEIGTATGDATEITAVADLNGGTKACAVIVPQTVAAGTALVKIVAGGKTLSAKLASNIAFASGGQYNLTVNIPSAPSDPGDDPTPVTEVTISLTSTSIGDWNPTDLDAITMDGVASPLNATITKPGSVTNGSWDASTSTYTWTGTTNNLLNCFTFAAGVLANYTKLHFTLANLTGGSTRINLLYSDNSNNSKTYGSNGTKDVTLTELLSDGKSLADVTAIRFGGLTMDDGVESASVTLTNMYLEK